MVVYHSDARNNTNLPNNHSERKYICNTIAISNYNIAKSSHPICIHLWDTK